MKRIINYLRKLKLDYYSSMMTMCAENNEAARVEHGEASKEAIYWLLKFNKYSDKYEKTLEKTV